MCITVLQGVEAAANLVVLVGAGVFFLSRIEERLKRRRALRALTSCAPSCTSSTCTS